MAARMKNPGGTGVSKHEKTRAKSGCRGMKNPG